MYVKSFGETMAPAAAVRSPISESIDAGPAARVRPKMRQSRSCSTSAE